MIGLCVAVFNRTLTQVVKVVQQTVVGVEHFWVLVFNQHAVHGVRNELQFQLLPLEKAACQACVSLLNCLRCTNEL